MSSEKNQHEKSRLHARNRNRERYDLNALIRSNPELKKQVKPNKYGLDSIDFANPVAVKILNKALHSTIIMELSIGIFQKKIYVLLYRVELITYTT